MVASAALLVVALAGCGTTPTGTSTATPSGAASPTASAATPSGASAASALGTPPAAVTGLGSTPITLPVHRTAAPADALPGVSWRLAATTAAVTALDLSWAQRSSAACGAATDAYVNEQASVVIVDVVAAGTKTGVVCPQVLRLVRMPVSLATPLGSRTIETHLRAGG